MPEIEQLDGDAQLETTAGASGSELSPPQNALFGKYELGKLLGCGAFGKVYHARNIRSGQSVAIKTISKRKVVKGGLVPHIKREISIMRRMRHPRIVKLYEVLATKTKIYFVLEFIKGGELFSKIAKGRLDEDLSRRYFQQLISAIGYCHSHGVFHRDLKPENLLLDENSDLKVSDFGLSAIAEQIHDDGLLHTLCGTPAYVAPEILAKKGYDGSKVDIWSCGIILYVLNAGYLPFNDPNLMKMYKKIYRGEYRSPRWFSVELRRLLSRLLDTNPETRITVHEITRDNWFRKGGIKELKFHEDDDEFFESKPDKNEQSNQFLNAFDIISFSSGFDLSGLFNESDNPVDGRKFLSAQAPERIVEKLQEVGKREGMSVRKKNESLIGMQKAYLLIKVEVYRLTETLVVVDVKKKGGDIESSEGVWTTKILPELSNLVYRQESRVAGDIASTS